MATLAALSDALEKAIWAILFNPCLNGNGVGKICPNRYRVCISRRLHEGVCFLGKPPRIQREDLACSCVLSNRVEYYHVFGAKAARKCSRRLVSFDSFEICNQLLRLTPEVQYNSN